MKIAINDEELMIQDTAKQFGETELKSNAKKVEEANDACYTALQLLGGARYILSR